MGVPAFIDNCLASCFDPERTWKGLLPWLLAGDETADTEAIRGAA